MANKESLSHLGICKELGSQVKEDPCKDFCGINFCIASNKSHGNAFSLQENQSVFPLWHEGAMQNKDSFIGTVKNDLAPV